MAFFALLSSWLLLRGLRRGKASDFVWYGAACALGAYTHLTMVFMPIAHAVACALLLGVPGFDKAARRRWRLPAVGLCWRRLTLRCMRRYVEVGSFSERPERR